MAVDVCQEIQPEDSSCAAQDAKGPQCFPSELRGPGSSVSLWAQTTWGGSPLLLSVISGEVSLSEHQLCDVKHALCTVIIGIK